MHRGGNNMLNISLRKALVFVVIGLFMGASFVPSISSDELFLGTTIYVDDDNTGGPWDGTLEHPYQHIQDGIDVVNTGDTIYVYSGTYYENIFIDKSIKLFGENRDNTIIDGQFLDHVLHINSDNSIIDNFTIKNSGESEFSWENRGGIYIKGDRNIIRRNIISNNENGVITSYYSVITNNFIINNERGVYCRGDDTNILYNDISNNDVGVYIDHSFGSLVHENNFINNIQNGYFKDDGFYIIFQDFEDNRWNKNYWDKPRVIPYLIPGQSNMSPFGSEFALYIPFFKLDKSPSSESFDITI
jgi:nitrous oxidase accessory protein NosD